ncbi:Uncharacterised protein [uncultured archaeon]|nr:Uncharacterised protein [uncultured archaeon]
MISNTKELDALFGEIGKKLSKKVTLYVFGGAALMFSGLKDATKDIDVVLETREELGTFVNTLKKLGFESRPLTEEYKNLEPAGIYNRQNDRFDVFLKIICGKLSLSKNMIARSKIKGTYSNLVVSMLSSEDIFLLKSVFSRAGDYEDCVALFKTGINWNTIYDEITDQSKGGASSIWKSYLLERIEEMQEREHIQVPIYNKLLKDLEQETYPYLAIYLQLYREDLSEEDLLKRTELDKPSLNRFLNLLLKNKKVKKTSDGKYRLKVRSQQLFLPGK